MKIKELSILEFDNFSSNHVLGSFYQSSSYALVLAEKGFDYEYIGLIDEIGELVAASLILIKPLKKNIKYGYAPKGFLIDYTNEYLLRSFTELLIEYYKYKNVAFIKINPYIAIAEFNKKVGAFLYNDNKKIRYTLERNNFLKLKSNMYFESSLPRFDGIVSLKDFSYNKLSKNTRNKVNKSIRKGLILEKGNVDSLALIDKLHKKNKGDTHININDFFNVFNKNDAIDIFVVKVDYEEFLINTRISNDKEIERNTYYNSQIVKNPTEDNINIKMNSDLVLLSYKNDILEGTKGLKDNKEDYIAAALVIKENNIVTVVDSVFDRSYSRFNANYFLYYKIMEYYKNDFSFCDLNGMTGDFSYTNPYYGLNKFKLGFNPRVFEFIGEFDLIIDENQYSNLKESGALVKEFNKKTSNWRLIYFDNIPLLITSIDYEADWF